VGEAHLRVHGFERHVDSSVHTKRLVLGARTRRWPRGTTSRCRALAGSAALGREHGLPRSRAVPPASTAERGPSAPGSGRGSGRMFTGGAAPAPTVPARSDRTDPATRSRRCRYRRCYTSAPTQSIAMVPEQGFGQLPQRRLENGDPPCRDIAPDLREHGRDALFCYPSPPWRTASSLRARSPI
jgi:hypothetical protein